MFYTSNKLMRKSSNKRRILSSEKKIGIVASSLIVSALLISAASVAVADLTNDKVTLANIDGVTAPKKYSEKQLKDLKNSVGTIHTKFGKFVKSEENKTVSGDEVAYSIDDVNKKTKQIIDPAYGGVFMKE
ncbi:hypothetical protein D3C73_746470 [compost metagenome]